VSPYAGHVAGQLGRSQGVGITHAQGRVGAEQKLVAAGLAEAGVQAGVGEGLRVGGFEGGGQAFLAGPLSKELAGNFYERKVEENS
jgi:hypothetical protein